ncbi:DUF4118 domain-containing protein [Pseudidiomarina sp.]|uniref:sensor histidine kinase n=1 Tax=Pseudidiomarina sp. TaxID=2081707 RepID=UPI003A97C103
MLYLSQQTSLLFGVVKAIVIMTTATALAFLLERWLLPSSGTVLLILAGVIVTALSVPNRIAYGAVVFGAMAFNFLFTEPRGSWHMQDVEEISTMTVFFAIGIVVVYLITRERLQRFSLQDAELRSTILLSLSHDLRSPLTSIIGNLSTFQLYQHKIDKAQQDELIDAAMVESERLHTYLENLFQATRFEHGIVNLSTQSTPLVPLVQRVIERFANQEEISLSIEDSALNGVVEVQTSLFEQALYNLFDNALRYRKDNTPVLCRIGVSASGFWLSITNEVANPLNETPTTWLKPFYSSRRGDQGHGGAGLGLSVAHSIILAHHGRLAFNTDQTSLQVRVDLP